MKAIIDRIDKVDKNQMNIIDYKTGKKMLNEKKMKQYNKIFNGNLR